MKTQWIEFYRQFPIVGEWWEIHNHVGWSHGTIYHVYKPDTHRLMTYQIKYGLFKQVCTENMAPRFEDVI